MTTRMAQLKRSIWCLGAAALVLALCSKTSSLYAFNDWMDANIFFTMGKSMLSGKVLYRDVFDHKGPVLYLLYGLGWLLDHTGFIGVFVLEICGFAVFLGLGLCTAELLRGKPLHPVWCLVPAAAVAACRAFSHGGSAEELLLPFLAAALYGLVKCLTANRQMPLRTVALQGFLCGCALLLKYTVLGFYLAWVAVLAVLNLLLSPAHQKPGVVKIHLCSKGGNLIHSSVDILHRCHDIHSSFICFNSETRPLQRFALSWSFKRAEHPKPSRARSALESIIDRYSPL